MLCKIDPAYMPAMAKGQMKSECIYEIINFPKYHRKDLIDFCHFRLGMSAKATKSFGKDLLYENLRI